MDENNDDNKITSLQIKKKTLKSLKKCGAKGETYDQIIQRLLPKTAN